MTFSRQAAHACARAEELRWRRRGARSLRYLIAALSVIGIVDPGLVSARSGCCNVGASTCQDGIDVTTHELGRDLLRAGRAVIPADRCAVQQSAGVPQRQHQRRRRVRQPGAGGPCANAGGTASRTGAAPELTVALFNNPPVCCNVSINGADACANPAPVADRNAGLADGRGTRSRPPRRSTIRRCCNVSINGADAQPAGGRLRKRWRTARGRDVRHPGAGPLRAVQQSAGVR